MRLISLSVAHPGVQARPGNRRPCAPMNAMVVEKLAGSCCRTVTL